MLISSIGFITPVDVSLCVIVTKSYLPVFNASSTISGFVMLPASDLNKSALMPLETAISCHLSPNDPIENTAALSLVQHLTAASIKPVPEDVDSKISFSV